MSKQDHASNTETEEPMDDSDAADFTVELRDHPALVRPDVEVGLDVELRGVHLSVVRDGVLDWRSGAPFQPTGFVHRRVCDAVENAGYSLVEYDDVAFDVPDDGDELTTVEFSLRVTGADDSTSN